VDENNILHGSRWACLCDNASSEPQHQCDNREQTQNDVPRFDFNCDANAQERWDVPRAFHN
jgi:hypothetical protein